MRLYAFAWRASSSVESQLRVVKIILDTLQHSPQIFEAARSAACTLPQDRFRVALVAGLAYYAEDYAALLSMPPNEPEVRALQAEAFRKNRRYDDAIRRATQLLQEGMGDPDPFLRDARVSALCCRGYCRLELGRGDASVLPLALRDLEAAVREATESGLPVPPRALTGMGYVLRLQGRTREADDAFARALALDPDNTKALQALAAPG